MIFARVSTSNRATIGYAAPLRLLELEPFFSLRGQAAAAMADYYQVLGVPKTASQAEIKKAYKKLSLKLHPDKNPGPGQAEAQALFVKVGEAFSVLGDPDQRREYDASLSSGGRGGGGGGRGRGGVGEAFFTHRDAFAMFDQMFQEMDRHFAEMDRHFDSAFQRGRVNQEGSRGRSAQQRGLLADPFMAFHNDPFFGGGSLAPFGGGGFSSSSSSSFSSSSFSGGTTSGRSVSTSTFIDASGKRRSTRTTTVVNQDGTRETKTEEWEDDAPGPAQVTQGDGGWSLASFGWGGKK